jgi:hypothetical protein
MRSLALCLPAMLTLGCTETDVLAGTPEPDGAGCVDASGLSPDAGVPASDGSANSSDGSVNALDGAINLPDAGRDAGFALVDGGFRCPPGFGYIAGNCVTESGCAGFANQTPCGLADGGVGFCYYGSCLNLNLQTDPNNCGQVGLVCASGTSCVAGACQGNSTCVAGACPTGSFCFGNDCYYGPACIGAPVMATCYQSSTTTESGFCCGGACVSADQLAGDRDNCGWCGNVCPAGSVCVNSTCVTTTCSAASAAGAACYLPDGGQTNLTGLSPAACCGGDCVDLTQDPRNCGACSAFCPVGQSCVDGACTQFCKSNADCGAGAACLGAPGCYPTTCASGSSNTLCAIVVSSSTVIQGACCQGTCTSLQADPANCGACGAACTSGACVNGGCTSAPPPTCADQPPGGECYVGTNQGVCCGGTCTFNDDSNCGGCGIICPTGSTCTSVGGTPQCAVNGQPAPCTNSMQCASGEVCFPGPGTCASETCGAKGEGQSCGLPDGGSGTCCSGRCSDLITDSQNCQNCGAVCPMGTICVGADESDGPLANCLVPSAGGIAYCSAESICPAGYICPTDYDTCQAFAPSCAGIADGTSCGFGWSSGSPIFGTCCGGECVNIADDPANCGGCGQACASGQCVASPLGGSVCTPPPAAACPLSCAPGSVCLGTTCQSVTCESVFSGFCPAQDGNVGVCAAADAGTGYTCVDLTNDPANCGAVGVVCPAGQSCRGSVCTGTSAPCDVPGALDKLCNLDAGFGWVCCQGRGCVDLNSDSQSCGACGTTCPSGQSCTQGVCG